MQPRPALHPKLFVALTHAVGLATVALTAGGFYLFAHRPLNHQQENHRRQCEQLKQRLEGELTVRREHVKLRSKLEKITERIERSRSQSANRSEESRFQNEVNRIAHDAGLEIEYRRGQFRNLSSHKKLDITLNGQGSYENLCQFLEEFDALPQAKRVTRLSVNSDARGVAYPFTIAYTLYFDLDQSAPDDQT